MTAAYAQGLKLSSQGRHAEAICQFEQALTLSPDEPKILFALGNTASRLGLAGPAEQFFRRVLALDPGRLEAIVNLANLLRAAGQYDAAIALLMPASSREPESPELHLTLGSAWREKGDFLRAATHYEAALAVSPNYAPALANLADMRCDAGDRDAARTLYDKAIRCDPGSAQARLNRAVLHLLNGNLKDGWRDYAARIDVPGKVPALAGEQRFAAWTGDSLKNKRLLVRAEQGVGDQILFASLIPDLASRPRRQVGNEGGKQDLVAHPLFGADQQALVLQAVAGPGGKTLFTRQRRHLAGHVNPGGIVAPAVFQIAVQKMQDGAVQAGLSAAGIAPNRLIVQCSGRIAVARITAHVRQIGQGRGVIGAHGQRRLVMRGCPQEIALFAPGGAQGEVQFRAFRF